MSWNPISWISRPGLMVAAEDLQTITDGLNSLRSEHFSVQRVHNMHLRTHPNWDTNNIVSLVHADELVMDDGTRLGPWDDVDANILSSGAGGLDVGSFSGNEWYEIYAIAKDDGTKSLMFHKAKAWITNFTGGVAGISQGNLRDTTAHTKIAQGIKVTSDLNIEFIDVNIIRVGSPSGRVWFTLETDLAGSPSGAVAATSDRLEVAHLQTGFQIVRIPFRAPVPFFAGTQYHLVMQGDFTVNASNYVAWLGDTSNSSPNGEAKAYNGSSWSAGGMSGSVLDLIISQGAGIYPPTTFTYPAGYTKKCKLGYVYSMSGLLQKFVQYNDLVQKIYTGGQATIFVVSQTNNSPALVDVQQFIPPCLCYVHFAAMDNISAQVAVGGVPDGYTNHLFNQRHGGVDLIFCAAFSTTPSAVGLGTFVDFGGVYTCCSGGTYSVGIGSYRICG